MVELGQIKEACKKGVKEEIAKICLAFWKDRNFYRKAEYKNGQPDIVTQAQEIFNTA